MPTFTSGSNEIHYKCEGAGEPLLFIHGLGGNVENWILQRSAFAATHRVLAIDLPGHGRSQGREVPFTEYWRAIEGLCDHLAIEAASICGLSKGARAGLMFAARRPRRVIRIAVVNAFINLADSDKHARMELYDLLLRQPDGPRQWADRLLQSMGVNHHPSIVRGFHRSLCAIDPVHIHARFNELIRFDQRAELNDVRCPALLVRGEQDGFVPAYCVDDLHQRLEGSAVVRLADRGHLPYLENPDQFNAVLTDFLAAS